MLFQSSDAVGEENLVGELFKNFAEGGDDPAFLSSPESEFEFIQPPLSHQDLEYGVGVVPLSSPSIHHPAIAASNAELYPRNIANNNSNNKRHRGMIDIERWTPYNPTVRQYFTLFDGHQEEVGSGIEVHTKIDKIDQKEHFSAADEAFILYRQNQFQLDVDMFGNLSHYSSNPPTPSAGTSAQTTPLYVNVNNMLVPVECLYYHIYAVKQHKGVPVETSGEQESLVDLVQLGGPRNRKDFQLPGLCPIVQGRATYARLQFRAATPNNARVHPDQPNPNQQYYRVVLSLVAKTSTALNFIFSKISPCFMVRGQNPGKFVQSTVKPLSPPTPVPKQEQFSPSNNYPQLNYPPSPTSTLATSTSTTSTSTTTTTIINNNNNNMVNNNMINNNNMVSNNNMVNNTSQITTNYNPFNPNPAQLPSLAAPIPTTPPMGSLQTPYRGTKRSVQGDEGWSSDGYGNVYTTGKVGVGMSDPQEALSVQGNILLTGDVLKPSDQRIKSNITPLSGSSQLDNIDRLKLYEYNLKHSVDADGNTVRERGVLAQELQQVMPQAVRVLKNVTLQDGTVMPELLVVHDRTLLYENIGATQELSRSVREQKSRLHALSESVAHSLHEMREGMVHAVSYLLSEKKRNYEYSCFFLSIFGLGPAWTMYMLGFFFPPLWFFGIFYISSIVPVKKTAGILHLVTLILFVIYTAFIIAWPFDWRIKLLAMLATLYLGVIVNIIFGIYWCRKMNEREFRINQGFELDCSDYDTNSMNLLLPPEAYSVPQTLLLEQGVQQQHKYTRGNSTLTPGEGETERGDIKSLSASNENIVNYQTFKQTKESNTQNTQNTQQVTTVSQQIISSRQSPRPSVPQFTLTSDDQKEEEEEEEKQQKQQHDGKKKTSKEKEEKDKPKSRKQ